MDNTMSDLRGELAVAAGLLRQLRTMAHAELKTPGNSVRWAPVDLEATNALDSLSTAPAFPEDMPETERGARAGAAELAAEVADSVQKAVELAQDLENKFACLEAAVHVSRLQRVLL